MDEMAFLLRAYSQECKDLCKENFNKCCEMKSVINVYKFEISLSCENNVVGFSFYISANNYPGIIQLYENKYTPPFKLNQVE